MIAETGSLSGVLSALIALVALVASGIGVFVALSAKNTILQIEKRLLSFQASMLQELDQRYWRKSDHMQFEAGVLREEEHYRTYAGEMVQGIQAQVYKNKDDVTILLKDILKEIERTGGNK